MQLAQQLLYDGDDGDGSVKSQAQTVLDIVATMKRRARSATIPWDVYLLYARADELPDVCVKLR